MELDQAQVLQGIMTDLLIQHLKPLYSGPVSVYFGPVTDNGRTFKVYLDLKNGINFGKWKQSVDAAPNQAYTIDADLSYFGRDDVPKGQVHFFVKIK
jgi:hypothetical protein